MCGATCTPRMRPASAPGPSISTPSMLIIKKEYPTCRARGPGPGEAVSHRTSAAVSATLKTHITTSLPIPALPATRRGEKVTGSSMAAAKRPKPPPACSATAPRPLHSASTLKVVNHPANAATMVRQADAVSLSKAHGTMENSRRTWMVAGGAKSGLNTTPRGHKCAKKGARSTARRGRGREGRHSPPQQLRDLKGCPSRA
mmetsp:Transcript_45733/g.145721  ORF Transcript_45733/g.145721 Transcript_45733/m.145721 type:complete len:201 (-) Transcript_45733:884-1486(-)